MIFYRFILNFVNFDFIFNLTLINKVSKPKYFIMFKIINIFHLIILQCKFTFSNELYIINRTSINQFQFALIEFDILFHLSYHRYFKLSKQCKIINKIFVERSLELHQNSITEYVALTIELLFLLIFIILLNVIHDLLLYAVVYIILQTQFLLETDGIQILLFVLNSIAQLWRYIANSVSKQCSTNDHPDQVHEWLKCGCFIHYPEAEWGHHILGEHEELDSW